MNRYAAALVFAYVFCFALVVGFVMVAGQWAERVNALSAEVRALSARVSEYEKTVSSPEVMREVIDIYAENNDTLHLIMAGGAWKVSATKILDCVLIEVPDSEQRLWMAGL